MAASKEFLYYILEQCSDLEEITYRMMMGEYIVYYKGKIIAYICDDRLLVKPVKSARELLPNAHLEPPYEGAKDMLLVEEIDNRSFMRTLFEAMYEELPLPQPRKRGVKKKK